jgi:Zn-dependent protease with chaperone function
MWYALKNFVFASLAVLLVPLLALWVAISQKNSLNDLFYQTIGKSDPSVVVEAKRIGLTLERICNNDPSKELSAICSYIHELQTYELGVYVALALGVAALLLSLTVPRLTGHRRKLFAFAFNPTVRMVTLFVGIAIVIQGVLAAYGIYLLEVIASGQFHPKIIFLVGLGGILVGGAVFVSSFSMLESAPNFVFGKKLSQNEQPEFFERIRSICRKLHAIEPDNVVVGLEPTFYVTANDIKLLESGEHLKNNTLFISLPLCKLLSTAELDAVMGHEFGHFAGEDTLYSMRFAPAYATLGKAIHSVAEDHGSTSKSLFVAPALAMLNLCMYQFARVERRISRQRELAADKAGSLVSSERALATALLKVGFYARFWTSTQQSNIENWEKGNVYRNLSDNFVWISKHVFETNDSDGVIADLAAATQAHPIDTHPSTGSRIQQVGLSLNSFSSKDVEPPTSGAASDIFRQLRELEEELTLYEHRWLIATDRVTVP